MADSYLAAKIRKFVFSKALRIFAVKNVSYLGKSREVLFALQQTGTNSEILTELDGGLMYETNFLTYWRSIKIISKISSPYTQYMDVIMIYNNNITQLKIHCHCK